MDQQVREAKHWLRLTGASPTMAVLLKHDGSAQARPLRGGGARSAMSAEEAKAIDAGHLNHYVWPRITIGRVQTRGVAATAAGAGRAAPASGPGRRLMPEAKRQEVVTQARAAGVGGRRVPASELCEIVVRVLGC